MIADKLCEKIRSKKNPCIVGLDPEWEKLPDCYKHLSRPEGILCWAFDIIDAVSDIVPAVKPQMAFYEVYGAEGVSVFEKIVKYAHKKDLLVVDDSKRGDVGNTSRAYAFAHLSKDGPINSDFLTVSPFLGSDSLIPFLEEAKENDKGLFVLVRTSNPGSVEIQNAVNSNGEEISLLLSRFVKSEGQGFIGKMGYSSIGAVVGATFPKEAKELRNVMKNNFFLVPGYGAQGGTAENVINCFNEDGLGALISSSRAITYKQEDVPTYDGTRNMYLEIVRTQSKNMQKDVYSALKSAYENISY